MLVGDESRRPLSLNDEVSLSDGYVLSGMVLGNGTQVWRLTPSDEVAVPPVRVVSDAPAVFELAGHRVSPVPGGRVLEAPRGSCSPGGFWVVAGPNQTRTLHPLIALRSVGSWAG